MDTGLIGRKIKDGEGIIVGVMFGKFVEMQHANNFSRMKKEFGYIFDEELAISSRESSWGEKWEEDLVVYVMFKEPRKTSSFEEFKTFYPYIKEEYMEEMYNKLVPLALVMSIPLSKVELKD